MTTSGTYVFNQNRDQIIRAAYRKVGAIAAGEIPSAQLIQDGADQLNSMVKYWMASGIHIWTETEAILYTQMGQSVYVLGTNSPDHSATIYTTTSLTSNIPQGTTIIQVASNYQITNGVNIGVILNTGQVFWTTVASFSGLSVTLAAPTTDSSAAGNNVYITSPNIVRPLRIPQVRRWDSLSQIETPLVQMSRLDYFALPEKNILGTITQYYYDPQGGANNVGLLYVWPTAADLIQNNLKFTFLRPIQDFNTAGNDPDLPQEWINPLVWNLAYLMAPEFGVSTEVYAMIKEQAVTSFAEVQGWDREPESAFFGVNFTQGSYGSM